MNPDGYDEDLDNEEEEEEEEEEGDESAGPAVALAPAPGEEPGRWLLLPDHIDKHNAIMSAGIPVEGFSIRAPRPVDGLAFPDSFLPKVMEIVGKMAEEFEIVPTEREGVMLLNESPKHSVTTFGGNMAVYDSVLPTFKKYAEKLNTRMHVRCPHGVAAAPENNPAILHVRLCSMPTATDPATAATGCARLFGVALNPGGNGSGVPPSRVGKVFSDPQGMEYAEYVGNTLYIYFDLLHEDSRGAVSILESIFTDFVFYKADPDTFEERKKSEVESRTVQYYLDLCLRRPDKAVQQALETIRVHDGDILHFAKELEIRMRKREDAQGLIDFWTSRRITKEDAIRELASIRDVDGVVSATMLSASHLRVETEYMFFEYAGVVYQLGVLFIDFYIGDSSTDLRVVLKVPASKTPGRTAYVHPHVKADGIACLGNIQTGVAKLLGQMQYAVVVGILIPYLRTCNKESRYAGPELFPVASAEETLAFKTKYATEVALKEAA